MAFLLFSSSDEEAGPGPPGPGREPNEAESIAAAPLPARPVQTKSKRKACIECAAKRVRCGPPPPPQKGQNGAPNKWGNELVHFVCRSARADPACIPTPVAPVHDACVEFRCQCPLPSGAEGGSAPPLPSGAVNGPVRKRARVGGRSLRTDPSQTDHYVPIDVPNATHRQELRDRMMAVEQAFLDMLQAESRAAESLAAANNNKGKLTNFFSTLGAESSIKPPAAKRKVSACGAHRTVPSSPSWTLSRVVVKGHCLIIVRATIFWRSLCCCGRSVFPPSRCAPILSQVP